MKRALIALFSIPLLCSAFFGVFAFIAAPIMLVVTAVIALPIFLILKRLNWLAWWHSCISGGVCGAVVALVYWCIGVLVYWKVSPSYHIEYIGAQVTLFFVSLGSFIGLFFWWAGIFRNDGLPTTTVTFPLSMIVLIPITALAAWAYLRMEPHFVDCRAFHILGNPTIIQTSQGS
jgi:hypothetical protein